MKNSRENLLEKADELRRKIKWTSNRFIKARLRNRAEELRAEALKKKVPT